jgi:hypothetical protein
MGPAGVDEDLSLSFASDDDERRVEFGRRFARYVRRHRERWDITAVLEPVQLLGTKTGEVNVHLHRSAPGQLEVTIQFQLEPCQVTGGIMRPASQRLKSLPGNRIRVTPAGPPQAVPAGGRKPGLG